MDSKDVIDLLANYNSIENTLMRRGFKVGTILDSAQVISTEDEFYEEMKSAPLRQILKLIYESDSKLDELAILERVSNLTKESLLEKLDILERYGCIIKDNNNLYNRAPDVSYSRTFEWFISETIKKEMKGIASSGVKVLELKCGGDFDVISRLEETIVYIECKSGSVLNIDEVAISNFLGRYKELAPSMAILLIDTNGLPSQFVTKILNSDWKAHGLSPRKPLKRRKRGWGTFYELIPRVHIVTNEGSISANIRLSVNHFNSFVKPYSLIAPGEPYKQTHYDEYELE